MFYTYFKPVIKREHLLFAGEIAQMYNIKTRTNKFADTFVSAYLQDIASKTEGYEQLFYYTRHGMIKVYPEYLYSQAINGLIAKKCSKSNIKQ